MRSRQIAPQLRISCSAAARAAERIFTNTHVLRSAMPSESYPPLLSLAVHEFRTPASVVGGYLRMLVRDPELSDRQRKMIEEAEKSCARLVAIVAELSDIGKLDSGAIALSRQPLDLFTLTTEVAELVHEGKEREVHLVVRGEATRAPIVGDATRLRNAIDAIFRAILREKGGPATVVADQKVEVRDGRRSAVLVVADEENVSAAYDALPGVFDDKRGGLGLALPLARRVIAGLGGEVWSPAAPEALARSAVVVRLPLTE
jgi:signal transduction histidine kinase